MDETNPPGQKPRFREILERAWARIGKRERGNAVRPETFLYAVLAGAVILFTASVLWVYAFPGQADSLAERSRERMPYPLVIVEYGQVISYRDLASNARAVRRFYENQDFSKVGLRVDFTTEEGQKRFLVREKEVLNKMIEDRALRELAKEYGIEVTRDSAREGIKRSLDEYGSSEQVQADLERLYGWTLADFEEKIVLPSLYQERLQPVFQKESEGRHKATRERMQAAETALREGKAFADVAREFSQGQTKDQGGALGWFQAEDLAPELQEPIALQKAGTPGSIVESSLGYHILLIEEVKEDQGKKLYRLSQVFMHKETFGDWLKEKMRGMPIWVLSPEYRWNQEAAAAEFKSEALRQFEQELYEKAQGDALFFF